MGEVDCADLVGSLMVVMVQAEAGDSVGNDALACQRVVIGPLEKLFLRMRIVDEVSAMLRELSPEVGAVVTRKPQRARRHRRIGPADHLKLEVGDNLRQWDRRMGEKGTIAEAADLF